VFNQEVTRDHKIRCLESGLTGPFPVQCQSTVHRQYVRQHTVVLYCKCRTSYVRGDQMVACNKCHKWFRCRCVGPDPPRRSISIFLSVQSQISPPDMPRRFRSAQPVCNSFLFNQQPDQPHRSALQAYVNIPTDLQFYYQSHITGLTYL